MEKILLSACLIGKQVRYDGKTLAVHEKILKQWRAEGRIISVCPEVESGMSVPRAPAEIAGGDGYDVLASTTEVIDNSGNNVSHFFKSGAQIALEQCREHNITLAVLAEGSPSCGSSVIHDGSFTGRKIPGAGVTTALLNQHGIRVFSQHELPIVDQILRKR
ncbi:MAG: DUF523 domain-containing protein [Halioglobus sp.]